MRSLASLFLRTGPLMGSLAITLLSASCTTSDPAAEAQLATVTSRGNADAFLIVDCLLPGKIRKLGTSMVYLSARQAVKTSASNCEIRGGEYVAYDRANYSNALAVWMPLAEEGDVKAQTYVGEIYEKGLGTAPDYAAAAQWYQKAAAQSYPRAQINLGALFEKGRGVPRNPTKAINLYRQASGLTSDQITFSSSVQAIEAERDTLRTELALRDREINLLRDRLNQTQKLLDTRRGRLDATQRELERTQRELQRQKRTPSGARPTPTPTPSRDRNIEQLEQRLTEQQMLLAQQREEFNYLLQEADRQQAQLRTELNAAQRRTKGFEEDAAFAMRAQASLQQQVAYLQRQLVAYQDRLNARKREMEAQRRELQQARQTVERQRSTTSPEIQRLQQQLTNANRQLEQTRQQVSDLERDVQRRQEQLRSTEQRIGELQDDVAYQSRERESLRQQIEYQRSQLLIYQDRLNARKQESEAQRREAQRVQQALEAQTQLTASSGAEVQRLQQQLRFNEEELNKTRQQVTTLENEVQRRQEELRRLRALQEEQKRLVSREATTGLDDRQARSIQRRPPVNFGRYYALVIGNNRYAHIPNLETAVNDGEAVAKVLGERYGFQTRVLTNADRYEILSTLEKFRQDLTEKDNFLLYYAGHGELDRANDKGNWLPVDAEPNSRANWIPNGSVTDILNSMSAKHVMVIADSCYSGTLARAVPSLLKGGQSEEARLKWLRTMVSIRSRTVLTSGGEKPVLDRGGGDSHSLFARRLLEVLQSNEGVLEGPVLAQRVASRVKTDAARLGVGQDPRYAQMRFAGDHGAPFLFVPL